MLLSGNAVFAVFGIFPYGPVLLITLEISEWNRVLVPGGKIYIGVPELDILALLFLQKDKLTMDERFFIMRIMYGGHIDQYDYHVVGLNE